MKPSTTDEGILGILGGMGPSATLNFAEKVVAATPAESDQEHIETIVYNDPKIPDRNEAILGDSESPLPRLSRNARRLEEMGAGLLAMPCNTAHYYYDELSESVEIELLNMPKLVATELRKLDRTTVGLLATTTVDRVGIYNDTTAKSATTLLYPEHSDALMDSIYLVKQADLEAAYRSLEPVIEELNYAGVETVVCGCTDLSLLSDRLPFDVIDPTELLAQRCVGRILDTGTGIDE